MIETQIHTNMIRGAMETSALAETIVKMQETCKNCTPTSMLECVTDCNIWKTKNEIKELKKKTQNPTFTTQLLNTLKNRRRIQALQILCSGRRTTDKIQQELRKSGFYHSQGTIQEEYIAPLLKTELATEDHNGYSATLFGRKINEFLKDFYEIGEYLPAHSECHEEALLNNFLEGPKTYEDLQRTVPAKTIPRMLSRLQHKGLLESNKEKDLVFFFKSRRDLNKEICSSTEKRVYENITPQGISARKLSAASGISLRRTYKYLRKLKGKKLIFMRENPRHYSLTEKGQRLALVLHDVQDFIHELSDLERQIVQLEDLNLAPSLITTRIRNESRKTAVMQDNRNPRAY